MSTINMNQDEQEQLLNLQETIEDLKTIEDLILSEVFNTGDDERMTEFRESLKHAVEVIKFKTTFKHREKIGTPRLLHKTHKALDEVLSQDIFQDPKEFERRLKEKNNNKKRSI